MSAKFLPNICQDVVTNLVCLLCRPGSGPTQKCLVLLSKRLALFPTDAHLGVLFAGVAGTDFGIKRQEP